MNKKIKREIRILENILLNESWWSLFGKESEGILKGSEGELKAAAKSEFKAGIEGAIKSLGADAKIVKDYKSLVAYAKDLKPWEKDALAARGVDVRKAVQEFTEAAKTGNKAKMNSVGSTLSKTLEDAKALKSKGLGGEIAAAGKESKMSAIETAATDGLSLTKEQRQQIDYWQKQADYFRKAGELEKAAAADAKAAAIMGPEFSKQVGVSTKEAEKMAEEVIRKRKLYDELVSKGLEDSPAAKNLLREIEAAGGKNSFLSKAWKMCKGSPWICAGLTALTAFGLYKGGKYIGQQLGWIDPDAPSKTNEPGGGSGRGCKGGIGRACSDTELKYGCVGDNVRPIQQQLIDCGFPLPKFGVDGRFCSETKGATSAFQRSVGLNADGIAGPDTQDALKKCNISKTEEPPEPQKKKPSEYDEEGEKNAFAGGKATLGNVDVGDITAPGRSSKSGETDEELQELKFKNKRNRYISKRYENLENLVFERLVKGCK